jgi:putative two-component system response regulator
MVTNASVLILMTLSPERPQAATAEEIIPRLEARIQNLSGADLEELLGPMRDRLLEPMPRPEAEALGLEALGVCRFLYAHARSRNALPLAHALLVQADLANDAELMRRASTACGLLLADSADVIGAIEHHLRALRISTAANDPVEASRSWNNIGLTFAVAGNHDLAVRCNQKALAEIRDVEGPIYSRYTAYANAANSRFQLAEFEEGLRMANLAMQESGPSFVLEDLNGSILLRRNLVCLLIATGRVQEAEPHVREVAVLAERCRTPRSSIAAATTRAAYEIAIGQFDIALTRLEQALARAREVPTVLRDTLAFVIRAEEAAGHTERALIRLGELSEHIYRSAIDRARKLVELADISLDATSSHDRLNRQTSARLVSRVGRREEPATWKALRRLAVGAALRVGETGWHGMRVGALTKALALANGSSPLEALEIGLAAELHDIGLTSVPEAILAKPGPLNDVERSMVRRHSDAGAGILCDDRDPRILMAHEIAKYHHAWWDGKGYPERVGGHLIPIAARMCAIADAYDVMVCGHPGRGPRSMNEALAELKRGAGTQFDPELTAIFADMIRRQARDHRIDPRAAPGFENFQQLISALQEDGGFA